MSGTYDWIIFPAALAFIAVIVASFWRDYRSQWEELFKCEQAAVAAGGARERLVACRLDSASHVRQQAGAATSHQW